jgi:hypothetical protein
MVQNLIKPFFWCSKCMMHDDNLKEKQQLTTKFTEI